MKKQKWKDIGIKEVGGFITAIVAVIVAISVGPGLFPGTSPEAPLGVEAHAGVELVTLVWEPSEHEDVTGYRVYQIITNEGDVESSILLETTNRTRFTLFGLDVGEMYHFSVSTLSATEESRQSNKVSGAPIEAYDNELEVHFINVGQGDSILILTPDEKVILIDSGVLNKYAPVKSYLTGLGITTIDVLVATHPHSDHIGNHDKVLADFDVMSVYDSGRPHDTRTYDRYMDAVQNEIEEIGCVFYDNNDLRPGMMLNWSVGIHFTVLHIDPKAKIENDVSIVIMMSYGTVDFLFTGDAELASENAMLASFDLDVEILKVGHHGSDTSSSPPFLAATSPELAVIQVGANGYGHPNQVTLDGLDAAGADVYRNDLHGNIVVSTDAVGWTVDCEIEP